MKAAIEKNESEIEKMKRESLEWIDRRGKTAPPFISLAINAFPSTPLPDTGKEVSDEDIIDWAYTDKTGKSDSPEYAWSLIIAGRIEGAKAMRDGKIKPSTKD
jgi:hypothetical protein